MPAIGEDWKGPRPRDAAILYDDFRRCAPPRRITGGLLLTADDLVLVAVQTRSSDNDHRRDRPSGAGQIDTVAFNAQAATAHAFFDHPRWEFDAVRRHRADAQVLAAMLQGAVLSAKCVRCDDGSGRQGESTEVGQGRTLSRVAMPRQRLKRLKPRSTVKRCCRWWSRRKLGGRPPRDPHFCAARSGRRARESWIFARSVARRVVSCE